MRARKVEWGNDGMLENFRRQLIMIDAVSQPKMRVISHRFAQICTNLFLYLSVAILFNIFKRQTKSAIFRANPCIPWL